MLDLNWAPLVGAAVMTTKTWNRLAPATKDAVMGIAKERGSSIQTIGRREATQSVAAMKQRGLKVISPSEEAKAQWRKAAEAAYPKIRGTIVPEETFDRVNEWIRDARKQ